MSHHPLLLPNYSFPCSENHEGAQRELRRVRAEPEVRPLSSLTSWHSSRVVSRTALRSADTHLGTRTPEQLSCERPFSLSLEQVSRTLAPFQMLLIIATLLAASLRTTSGCIRTPHRKPFTVHPVKLA